MKMLPVAIVVSASSFLSACSTLISDRTSRRAQVTSTVDRIYAINCGEKHAKDLSSWTTPADQGKPCVFSNNCYPIRHGTDWMLWDSGHADRIASMPDGLPNPRGTSTAVLKKPLVESLREIGVASIRLLAHDAGFTAGAGD